MSRTAGVVNEDRRDIYHDIYDFSLFPISLGDILNWGVKSALRADRVKRDKVHVHLVIDRQNSGFTPMQDSSYLADLFVVEALPAFYSHPYFAGLSVYRSRDDFRRTFSRIARDDEPSLQVYRENERVLGSKTDYDSLGEYFRTQCSSHEDINRSHKQTGTFPRIGFLEDCLSDWRALQAQFPTDTFWVSLQFRLRKLDGGMPVAEEGLERDAPFLTWYNFVCESYKRYPSVRFILLGRLQEKPLEILRLPNVIALRTLGMNLGHEIAALLHSDFYMGSSSGFAAAANLSDIPYDVFNPTIQGCENYGIPYGTTQLPFASSRQRLHYGVEDADTLHECLKKALADSPEKSALPASVDLRRVSSTDRFFTNESQNEMEISSLLSGRLKPIALAIERGEYLPAQEELSRLAKAFPEYVPRWPEFAWLSAALKALLNDAAAPREDRAELLTQVARYCHPSRLVRRGGRYFEEINQFEGIRRDGWCEKRARFVFAPSNKGDFLMIQIARLAASEPLMLSIRVNRQKALPFVLLNEYALLEVPVLERSIPTEIILETDQSFKVRSEDEKEHSYLIEGAALVGRQSPTQTSYQADKRDPREKVAAGIYVNGAASNLVHIRIDNPFSEGTEIMVLVTAQIPRLLRKGQMFRIQINQDEPHEAFITGKRLEVRIPCPGQPRHVALLLQFWNRNEPELTPKENRAMIRSIEIVPAQGKRADIQTGYRNVIRYLIGKLAQKAKKLLPGNQPI